MKLHLLAIGQKMPGWVAEGFREYADRMPRHMPLVLHELPLAHRGKNPDIDRLKRDEAERLLSAQPGAGHRVALDGSGKPWSTEKLARELEGWQQLGTDVALMVGGPDGLDSHCLTSARQRWSLGPLTLPHPLVRIIVAEQLYRACSILQNHPYHRA